MLRSSLFLAVGALGILSAANLRAAEVLSNGDFENQPNYGSPSNVGYDGSYTALTGSQIPGWTIASGHAATVHINPGAYPTISGKYSINMDGEGYNQHNTDMYQDFISSAASTYVLSFDWETWVSTSTASKLRVSIQDLTTLSYLYDVSFDSAVALNVFHEQSPSFAGNGDAFRLEVQEDKESGFNDNKFIVDNFSVQSADTRSVPEVTTWSAELLAAASLIGAGMAMRRRSTAQAS